MALDFLADAAKAAFTGELAFMLMSVAAGWEAVDFFRTDRVTGVDLLAGLRAGLLFFAEGVGVFAVFFIAFAIEPIAK